MVLVDCGQFIVFLAVEVYGTILAVISSADFDTSGYLDG